MSTIVFHCKLEEMEEIKKGVRSILKNHYFTSVYPNTKVEYDNEGEDVYLARLEELMDSELCTISDTEDGFTVEFDSTEDAGFLIADHVYRTSMGYSDNGLTFIDPVFDSIVEGFPDVLFEADTICADQWVYEENHYSYDGKKLSKDEDPSQESEDLEELPQNHFLRTTPRIYASLESLGNIYNVYNKMLSDEVKKSGKIDLNMTLVECTDYDYIAVLTPATEEAVAEAVSCGYPAEMGADAFFFVYKRYEGGPVAGDLMAIRAIVKTKDGVGFSEMCKDIILQQALNTLYLGIIDVQYYLRDCGKYNDYRQLDTASQAMLLSMKEDKIDVAIVSGDEIPEVEYAKRTNFEFVFPF